MSTLLKMKKAIFIILPLFIAIYFTYLINRIWDFSTSIILMIGIFFICILYFISYLFYKKIDYKNIEKKTYIKICVIATFLMIFVIGINFNFFTKSFTESSIEISYINQDDGTLLPIKKIFIDNTEMPLNDEQRKSPAVISFKKAKNIIVIFDKNQNSGVIKIKDGDTEKQIDLYSFKDDLYKYIVTSNTRMNILSVARLLISCVVIEILSIMFCIASYYLYKNKKSLILPTLFIIFVIQMIFYQQCEPYTKTNDTVDYETEYTKEQILKGELQGRVPIYPIIIKVFKLICGDVLWGNFLCIAQIIVCFISIIYLYKTLKLLINWEFLSIIVTFLYGVNLAIIGWNNAILTESLALSTTVFFCYFIISYIKKSNLKYGILSAILIFLMTFLRPSFIGYMSVLFAFFFVKMILDKEHRKNDLKCILVSLVTIVITLGYAIVFYNQHEIFSITKVSVRQDLYICIDQGFYKNSGDEQFIKDVESEKLKNNNEMWDTTIGVLEKYGNKKTQELVKKSKSASIPQYIAYILKTVNRESVYGFTSYYTPVIEDETTNLGLNIIQSFSFLKISTVYYIILIEGVLAIYRWIKYKKPNWINLGLFGFNALILVTTFIGTNSEWMRTAICVLPFSYIAIGTLISDCVERYKRIGV